MGADIDSIGGTEGSRAMRFGGRASDIESVISMTGPAVSGMISSSGTMVAVGLPVSSTAISGLEMGLLGNDSKFRTSDADVDGGSIGITTEEVGA